MEDRRAGLVVVVFRRVKGTAAWKVDQTGEEKNFLFKIIFTSPPCHATDKWS